MPLDPTFWGDGPWVGEPPTKRVIPNFFVDLVDPDPFPRGQSDPVWLKVQPGEAVRLTFWTDDYDHPLLFHKKRTFTVKGQPTTVEQIFVLAAACDMPLAHTPAWDTDFAVGFMKLTKATYESLRRMDGDFGVASHDMILSRATGQFGQYDLAPCKNSFSNGSGVLHDALDNIAQRIRGGEKF